MTPPLRHYRFAAAIWIAPLLAQGLRAAPQVADRPEQAVTQLRTEYEVLSSKFADSVPGWRPKAPATGSLLFIAPDEYTPTGNEGDQFRALRDKYADSLFFDLAKRAAAAGQPSLAFQWATETVCENPEFRHREAFRRALQRLAVRHVINAVDTPDGTRHYFIGNYPTAEIRASLGLP